MEKSSFRKGTLAAPGCPALSIAAHGITSVGAQSRDSPSERAENGSHVISKLDDGFRIYSVSNPSNMYHVRKDGERWTCTCPDYEYHRADTTWRCKHILAVAPYKPSHGSENPGPAKEPVAEPPATPANRNKPPRTRRAPQDHRTPPVPVQMMMKRSVSPDGRIDSISVEFSLPLSGYSTEEAKERERTRHARTQRLEGVAGPRASLAAAEARER